MLKNAFSAVLFTLLIVVSANPQSLKYSADGKTMAVNLSVSFGTDKLINHILFFDTASGKIKTSVNLSDIEFDKNRMMFASSGHSFLIGDQSETAIVKLTADDKAAPQKFESEIGDYEHPMLALAHSADGKTLFKLYSHKLTAYDFSTQTINEEAGKKALEAEDETAENEFLAIDPKGNVLVEYRKKGAKHSLVVHNLTAKNSKTIELPYKYEKKNEAEFYAEISNNGERIVLKCEKEYISQITVWDVKTALNVGTFTFTEMEAPEETNFYSIKNFTISPDGKKVAVKMDEKFADESDDVVLWDMAAKTFTNIEAKHYSEEYFAKSIAFSPDSKILAVSSEVLLTNSFTAKIQLLDANTGKFIRDF